MNDIDLSGTACSGFHCMDLRISFHTSSIIFSWLLSLVTDTNSPWPTDLISSSRSFGSCFWSSLPGLWLESAPASGSFCRYVRIIASKEKRLILFRRQARHWIWHIVSPAMTYLLIRNFHLQPFEALFPVVKQCTQFLEKLITWPRECGNGKYRCSTMKTVCFGLSSSYSRTAFLYLISTSFSHCQLLVFSSQAFLRTMICCCSLERKELDCHWRIRPSYENGKKSPWYGIGCIMSCELVDHY